MGGVGPLGLSEVAVCGRALCSQGGRWALQPAALRVDSSLLNRRAEQAAWLSAPSVQTSGEGRMKPSFSSPALWSPMTRGHLTVLPSRGPASLCLPCSLMQAHSSSGCPQREPEPSLPTEQTQSWWGHRTPPTDACVGLNWRILTLARQRQLWVPWKLLDWQGLSALPHLEDSAGSAYKEGWGQPPPRGDGVYPSSPGMAPVLVGRHTRG